MYFYKQSEALPRSAIFEKNVEKNRRYHVYSFKIKLLKALKTTTTPLPAKKNNVEFRLVLCTFNMLKLFREANLETEGQATTRLRKAFLVNTFGRGLDSRDRTELECLKTN